MSTDYVVSYDGYVFVANHPSSLDASKEREFIPIRIVKKLAGKDKIFVDVGACAGMYTVRVAKLYKKVIAIEPIPENVEILKKNLELNRITNVEILQYAVGEADYKIFMKKAYAQSEVIGKTPTEDSIPVEVRRLDGLVSKADVIKIDVEGYEEKAIDGASKLINTCKPFLIIEHHEYWGMSYPPLRKKIIDKLKPIYYPVNINQVQWLYIPRDADLDNFKEELAIHFLYKAIDNVSKGLAWYYGFPEKWWHGMSLLEFYEKFPTRVTIQEWIELLLSGD